MRRLHAIILVILGIHAVEFSWPQVCTFCQTTKEDRSSAVLSIITKEKGLAVFIDGQEIGLTPLRNLVVPAGEHEVVVRLNRSNSWLDIDWVEKYRLAPGDTLEVLPRFKRGFLINSKPYGAEVFLDEIPQGTTPVVAHVVDGEKHEVQLRLAGYENFSFSIDSSSQRLWNVALVADRERMPAHEEEKREQNSRRSHFRRLATISAAVSAASGVSAILLKRRADDFYDDYLSAGDPRELQSLYNKTSQYDEYAGTAFIVFEISFGLSFYWFLRSTTD